MTTASTHQRRAASVNAYTRNLLLPLLLSALVLPARSDDTLFHIYSRATPQSVVSRSLAGAGSAVPHDIFQGLINPALTATKIGASGAYGAGYGRDDIFNNAALPFGALFFEDGGAMGVFYRYLNGDDGDVHDAVVNFAGRLFDKMEPEGTGPVDFGLNIRYEHSKMRRAVLTPVTDDDNEPEYAANLITTRGNCLLLDIGFYQQYLPGLDFSLVFSNLAGYRWNEAGGSGKSEGWIDGRHRLITVGILCTFPISSTFTLRIPLDMEAANVFVKSRPAAYMLRAGAELLIAQTYAARFGYARAPQAPVEMVKKFDCDNLFFGGAGVAINGFMLDIFAGKNEFGASVTYGY
jgi:hypothetical protein